LFFGWIGAGNWYLGNYKLALVQVFSPICAYLFVTYGFVMGVAEMTSESNKSTPMIQFGLFSGILTLGMWLKMIVEISQNSITDGNNMEMYPNMCF